MRSATPTILILDDDLALRGRLRDALGGEFDGLLAATRDEASRLMGENYVQVLIADPEADANGGATLLDEVRERWPETARIAITGGDVTLWAEMPGIYQVMPKGCSDVQFRLAVRNAARLFQLTRENDRMALEMRCLGPGAESKIEARRKGLRHLGGFEDIYRTPGSPMDAVVDCARQYASFDIPALLTGEPGTGKGDLARAMHDVSLRSDRPFVCFDPAGLDARTIALELFGARNGSVPHGLRTKIGLMQKADRGTLFIDNVHLLTPDLQLALHRAMTDGAIRPVGGPEPVPVNIRLIAATSVPLAARAADGDFLPELAHALAVAEIAVPPLRRRPADIPGLAERLLFEASARHKKPVLGFSEPAGAFLAAYDWPGNLAELSAEVTRMLVFAQDRVLGPDLISRRILQAAPQEVAEDRGTDAAMIAEGPLKDRIETIEARILRETLTRHKWNKSRAATELGLSRVGLRAKLDRYGVHPPETEEV